MANQEISEISDVIKNHREIFKIKKDLKLKSLFDIRNNILSLYKLFTLLCDDYESKLSNYFYHDISSLISFYNQLFLNNNNAYSLFESDLIEIIDTKLYYFDQLVSHRANNNIEIQNYLRTKHIYKLMGTKHFLNTTNRKFTHKISTE